MTAIQLLGCVIQKLDKGLANDKTIIANQERILANQESIMETLRELGSVESVLVEQVATIGAAVIEPDVAAGITLHITPV
jgi:hypothetical protein